MLSPYARSITRAGVREFIDPHLHLYTPYATNGRLGIDSTRAAVVPMRLERPGERTPPL